LNENPSINRDIFLDNFNGIGQKIHLQIDEKGIEIVGQIYSDVASENLPIF
jgi:hypothetical protein